MLVSEMKPNEEILSLLEGSSNVYLVGCNGCADVCRTGGPAVVAEFEENHRENGKNVAGSIHVD